MTSLRELSGGRPIDRDTLLEAWLDRLEPRYESLRLGRFDSGRLVQPATDDGRAGGGRRRTPAGSTAGRWVSIRRPVRCSCGCRRRPPTVIDSGDVTRCRVVHLPGMTGRH